MYQDFCPRCGSAIDPKTGRCPDCAGRRSYAVWIILLVIALAVGLCIYRFRAPIGRGFQALRQTVEAVSSRTPQPEPEATFTRDEALKAAQVYLESDCLSSEALSLLLGYDGYGEEAIAYALEHCGANWYTQASYVAEDLVANYYFCRTLLIDELLSCGFTAEEAVYGADHCRADWAEEAALYSAYLLSENPDLSEAALLQQLIEFGFTIDEATYGVQVHSSQAPTL